MGRSGSGEDGIWVCVAVAEMGVEGGGAGGVVVVVVVLVVGGVGSRGGLEDEDEEVGEGEGDVEKRLKGMTFSRKGKSNE